MNKAKLFLFDCDQTLWVWEGGDDWVSRIESDFKRLGSDSLVRQIDCKKLNLRKGSREALQAIYKQGDIAGVVSDNMPESVKRALELFGLWGQIDADAVNVSLWKGYCPKHIMVERILIKRKFTDISRDRVYWIDDKDYAKEARKIGVNFVRINKDDDMYRLISPLV